MKNRLPWSKCTQGAGGIIQFFPCGNLAQGATGESRKMTWPSELKLILQNWFGLCSKRWSRLSGKERGWHHWRFWRWVELIVTLIRSSISPSMFNYGTFVLHLRHNYEKTMNKKLVSWAKLLVFLMVVNLNRKLASIDLNTKNQIQKSVLNCISIFWPMKLCS